MAAMVLTLLPEFLRPFAEYRMIIYSLLHHRPDDRPAAGTVWFQQGKSMMPALLQLEQVTIRFGGLTAVSELNLAVGPGELVGYRPQRRGQNHRVQPGHRGLSADRRDHHLQRPADPPAQAAPARAAGVARTFQNIRLFASLSVFDNVRAAVQLHRPHGIRDALWRGRGFHDGEASRRPGRSWNCWRSSTSGRSARTGEALPYGDQRRLEIVRALATRPKLLLLDEPAAGMNPTEKVELTRLIRFIQDKFQIAVLLVEHDMRVVMEICQRIAVLDYGVKIAEGPPAADIAGNLTK